jgi:hypothetical protein
LQHTNTTGDDDWHTLFRHASAFGDSLEMADWGRRRIGLRQIIFKLGMASGFVMLAFSSKLSWHSPGGIMLPRDLLNWQRTAENVFGASSSNTGLWRLCYRDYCFESFCAFFKIGGEFDQFIAARII